MNKAIAFIVGAVLLCSLGCKNQPSGGDGMSAVTDSRSATSSFVDIIRESTLSSRTSVTIGRAFDGYRYFPQKEWKAERLASGHITVDYIGWVDPRSIDEEAAKAGVSARGLEVKFVIEPDGRYYVFMITRIDVGHDRKQYRYPLKDIPGILSRIYANEKIAP